MMGRSRASRKRERIDSRTEFQRVLDSEAEQLNRSEPTDEALRHGSFYRAGIDKYQRIPVIDTMLTRKQITDREHAALAFYRDQADLAERSPLKSCLDQRIGGSSEGTLSAAVVSAILTVSRIERELGSLRSIARAIAVDGKSLSQWCVDQHGGRERYDGDGKFIAIVPIGEARVTKFALQDLRMAAQRIVPIAA